MKTKLHNKSLLTALLVCGAILLSVNKVSAQDAKFRAIYIFNFTKYMKWPDDMEKMSDPFKIGILGDSPVKMELMKIAAVRKVKGVRNIEIKQYNTVEELERCHIIYISKNASPKLIAAAKRVDRKGVLTVTHGPDLARKGSCINFVTVGTNQKFELNQARLKRQGIMVVNTFLDLAILVE